MIEIKHSARIMTVSTALLFIYIIGIIPTILLGVTLFSFALILYGVYLKGPLNYLSDGLRKVLLQRSIFDILWDIWYIPTITLYISALTKPILYDISPLDAKKNIESLPHDSIKKMIFTKGIINIFPEKVSKTLKNNLANPSQKNIVINDAASHSGSTRSDEETKIRSKEMFSSLEWSDEGSIPRSSFRKSFEDNKKLGRSLKQSSFTKNKRLNSLNLNTDYFTNDVSGNPKYFNNGDNIVIELEEEKCDLIPVNAVSKYEGENQLPVITSQNTSRSDRSEHVVIIPISSSQNFNKSNNKQGYEEFLDLFAVKTTVLGSSKMDLVGTIQSILPKAQLEKIEWLMEDEIDMNNPQIKSLINPNFITEDDVFWDNFWLFKKKEEERKINQTNVDSDDEPEKKHKIGDLMKNPQILIQIVLKKYLKKLKKNVLFVNSIGGFTLMTLLFLIQLKYSRRFRNYAKVLIHISLFGITIVGFGGSLYLFYKGITNSRNKKITKQHSEVYEIKNEELPEINHGIEFKKI